MANDRPKSMYDLTLNTNTHTRIQTALQTGNLIAQAGIFYRVGKTNKTLDETREEIRRGNTAITSKIDEAVESINATTQRLIDDTNRNADDAARQRYSLWVSTSQEGETFHRVYKPRAESQIETIAAATDFWLTRVSQAFRDIVDSLDPNERAYVLGRRRTITDPPPVEQYPAFTPPKFRVKKAIVSCILPLIITCLFMMMLLFFESMSSTKLGTFQYRPGFQMTSWHYPSIDPSTVDKEMREYLARTSVSEARKSDNPMNTREIVPAGTESSLAGVTPKEVASGQTKELLLLSAIGGVLSGPLTFLVFVLAPHLYFWRRRQVKHSQIEYQETAELYELDQQQRHASWKSAENHRVAALTENIKNQLGLDEDHFADPQFAWSLNGSVEDALELRSFLDTAYRSNPLREDWLSLLPRPVVRDWENPTLHQAALEINTGLSTEKWADYDSWKLR